MPPEWNHWMTKADYDLLMKNMPKKFKKDFERGFGVANSLMSWGALGLLKTVNSGLTPDEIAERRKDIPRYYPWVKPEEIMPYEPDEP